MPTQKKIDTVNQLTDKVGKARSMVLADYTGITHKQLETLRKTLKKSGAEFVVVKNKLFERSLGDVSKSLDSSLKENTAVLFNYDDEVGGLKELLKFFKSVSLGKTKAGLMGKTILSHEEVNRLAKLPGRQELLSQLVGQLQAPLYGLRYALSWNINKLVWGLNNIKTQKSK